MCKIEVANARALLASTQQLRTHWSSVITSHLGIAITVNVALWAYFLKSYVDSFSSGQSPEPQYLLAASAISSVLLGLWRLYTRYLDDHIAALYPAFLHYEGILGTPQGTGTSAYLVKEVKGADRILLNENFSLQQKIAAISYLVDRRQIGHRGHLYIDRFVEFLLFVFLLLSSRFASRVETHLFWILIIGNLLGFLFLFLGITLFQRKLKESCLNDAIKESEKAKLHLNSVYLPYNP